VGLPGAVLAGAVAPLPAAAGPGCLGAGTSSPGKASVLPRQAAARSAADGPEPLQIE